MPRAHKAAAVVLALLICAQPVAAKRQPAADEYPQPYGALSAEPPYTDEFKSLVANGLAELKAGNAKAGIADLMRAAKLKLRNGWPNFELWDDVGAAQCAKGDREAGRWLLKSYRCAVNVWAERTACHAGTGPSLVPNADMTPLCFRTFCGDVWQPSPDEYSPADGDAMWDDPGANELARVDALIKACRAQKTPD